MMRRCSGGVVKVQLIILFFPYLLPPIQKEYKKYFILLLHKVLLMNAHDEGY